MPDVADTPSLILLTGLCAAAAACDLKWGRLPPWLTWGTAAVGLAWSAIRTWGLGEPALGGATCGFAFGFLVLFVPYLCGGVGGGDVKLAAAVGSLLGFRATLGALFYAGVVAIGLALTAAIREDGGAGVRRLLRRSAAHDPETGAPPNVPFGFALALGSAWAALAS